MLRRLVLGGTLVPLIACAKPSAPADASPIAISASPTPAPAPTRMADVTLKLNAPVEVPGLSGFFALESFVVEAVEPDPNDPSDPGGAGVVMTIHAGSSTVEIYVDANPAAPRPVAWTETCRMEVVGYDPAVPSVDLAIDRISDALVPGEPLRLSLKRGEVGDLGDGVQIRFEGHSHKRTFENQRSPLIVEITYDLQGSNHLGYTSLFPPEQSTWSWRDYAFDLVGWEYGTRVDLEVGRHALVPVDVP